MRKLMAVVFVFHICCALTFLSGCGGKGGEGPSTESVPTLTPAESVPTLTPAEKAETDKYIKGWGRDAIAAYLSVERSSETDEKLILKYLKYFVDQGANVNAKNSRYNTPLYSAVERGNIEIVELLVSKGADVKEIGLLYEAVSEENIELVKFLVSKGADVNAEGKGGKFLAYDEVAMEGKEEDEGSRGPLDTPFHLAVWQGNIEIAKFLMSKGADVNAKDGRGDTLVHRMVRGGETESVEFILSIGADVNAKNHKGQTPLHIAVIHSQSDSKMIEFLVSKGADVNAKDGSGETPLDVAARRGNREAAKYLAGVAGVPIPTSKAEW